MVALRKLLGPQAITTIPGRGYRFTMRVDAVNHAGPSKFAPATVAGPEAAPPPARGNLPDSPTLFGRAQDLDAVDALLREHAVVTIVGAGGIGKTRLAMAAAAAARLPISRTDAGGWSSRRSTRARRSRTASPRHLALQLPSGRQPHGRRWRWR